MRTILSADVQCFPNPPTYTYSFVRNKFKYPLCDNNYNKQTNIHNNVHNNGKDEEEEKNNDLFYHFFPRKWW